MRRITSSISGGAPPPPGPRPLPPPPPHCGRWPPPSPPGRLPSPAPPGGGPHGLPLPGPLLFQGMWRGGSCNAHKRAIGMAARRRHIGRIRKVFKRMSTHSTAETLRDALRDIADPVSGHDIVTAGLVEGIEV